MKKPQPNIIKLKRKPYKSEKKLDAETVQKDQALWVKPGIVEGYPEASRAWDEIGLMLVEQKAVTLLDKNALASYCAWWAKLVEAELKLIELGPVLEGPSGLYLNPWSSVAKQAALFVYKWGAVLGLDPLARTKIKNQPGEKEDNFLDE